MYLKSNILTFAQLAFLFVAVQFTSYAQVGINTTDPQGALDIVSTNSGLIVPRVANATSITPVSGMMVYDQTLKCLRVGIGTPVAWSGCL